MDSTVKWNEVINNLFFKNASFKVKLNKFGQILMCPASNKRGIFQNKSALEVWIVKESGDAEIYSHTGRIETSRFVEKLTF